MYQPDGAFTQSSTTARTANFSNADGVPPRRNYSSRLAEVPRFINLDAHERVVANFRPPYRASSPAKGHSLLASFRDKIVLMAYGRRSLLRAPTHIITDSQQRIIISDPDLQAVHVLDQTGRSAFRIAGGPQHRFQSADAIAVDAEDSIFIADGQNGTIEVFDRDGQFLRTIGMFKGERRFEKPTAIAINQKKALLYVLDGPANEVFVCDLEGNLVQRISNRTKSGIKFVYPTEIAVLEDRIFIIDDVGSRVQVFDSSFNPRSSFRVKVHQGTPVLTEIGLAADATGRIYLSNLFPDQLAVFEENGRLVALFGHSGARAEEFRVPSGLWIDSADRIYIAIPTIAESRYSGQSIPQALLLLLPRRVRPAGRIPVVSSALLSSSTCPLEL
jgi:DNA-binding beta-propeller fold protein YncE